MLSSKHIMTMDDLTRRRHRARSSTPRESFAEVNERRIKKLPTLRGRTVVNLFLEPSTRTRTSFEIAAKRLSADGDQLLGVVVGHGEGRDACATPPRRSSAMACDLVIVRHKYAGAPQMLAECMDAHIVNGGDGIHEHPTQALLDLYTMRAALGRLEGLHGRASSATSATRRVAGSLVPALRKVGATPIVIAPPTLLPARPDVLGAEVGAGDLRRGAARRSTSRYMLRIQIERAETACRSRACASTRASTA